MEAFDAKYEEFRVWFMENMQVRRLHLRSNVGSPSTDPLTGIENWNGEWMRREDGTETEEVWVEDLPSHIEVVLQVGDDEDMLHG